MFNLRAFSSQRVFFVVLGFLVLRCGVMHAQMVDLNANGMSDIWELIYGAASLDPQGDADGDDASNLQEAIAGTDPFDSNSVSLISATAVAGTNVTVSIACGLGKQYQLQSVQPLS